MENKVLIKILFPELECSFDVFIPVNEIVWKIKRLISKAITDLSDTNLNAEDYIFINKESGQVYDNNEVIINTNIRNGTELILLSKK